MPENLVAQHVSSMEGLKKDSAYACLRQSRKAHLNFNLTSPLAVITRASTAHMAYNTSLHAGRQTKDTE